MEEISWWPKKSDRANEDGWLPPANMSIFHAQAEEIRESREDENRIFRYEGLRDWRDVAIRALQSIGWNLGCVYEDAIYPQRIGSNAIRWDRISSEESPKRNQHSVQNRIEISIMDWQLGKMGASMTLVRRRDCMLLGYIQIMGRSIGDTTRAQPGLALAASLTQLGRILIQNSEQCILLNSEGEITIYILTTVQYTVKSS